jgi:flagellar hook-length control protein FliK
MNVNLLITENYFTPATSISSVQSKPDADNNGAKFSVATDDKYSQVSRLEKPTTDNVSREIHDREEPVNESPHKFTQSIHKQTKSENPAKAENKTKPKEQIANSGTIKQASKKENLIQSWLAKNSVAGEYSNSVVVEHSKKGTATKIEPKAGQQLAQIINNTPAGKPTPVTGHAVKSAEIKLLHATEKGQLGLKTVLPAKSNGENGLKAVLTNTLENNPAVKKQAETGNNTDKISVLTKTITETKPATEATEKKNTTELAPEIPTNTGKSTNVSTVKQTAEYFNLKTVQAKTSEMQPQPAGINPEKPAQTDQTDAKANASLKISNSSNPNGKETAHTGNDIPENQSVQKLNIAAVQVSTDQTKDRSIPTSNKSTSQGLEQILSHNNSQTVSTEQTPSAAKNITTANLRSQISSNDVSSDIGKQILESVQRSISQQDVDRQITVRLNPPELGKVFIKFQQHNNELTGIMEVSKSQTRFEIEQTLPQIIRNLADSGIQIRRLEVTLSNEQPSGQGALGNQSLQSGGSHQQYSGNSGTSGNDLDIYESNEWLAGNNSYDNLSELQEALIADGSINLLI